MKIGDTVRVTLLPPRLSEGELNTKSTFERCLGREFEIIGFDTYGALELDVSSTTGNEFETIWIEPEFVVPVP